MIHHNPTKRRHFPVAHLAALLIVSIMLLVGAITKFSNNPAAIDLFSRLSLLPFMKAFGTVQLIILVCLWFKPLRILGTLLASAYFGAGAVMMLSLGESAVTSTVLLVLTLIIHKCTWWSMWEHGYRCACKSCAAEQDILPRERNKCECGKPGCACEHGKCLC